LVESSAGVRCRGRRAMKFGLFYELSVPSEIPVGRGTRRIR
jgi:hypothetical protein